MTEPHTRILVIDNYDSFAYNLVQYVAEAIASAGPATSPQDVGEIADEVIVRRNDAIDLAGVRDLEPTGIVVSPGPGTPQKAGVSIPLFAETEYPILGVCLGHQALCAANGAPVVHAPDIVHGKPSAITHEGEGLFEGLPATFQVGRYHSLAVDRADLPASLEETARTTDERGVLMAVRHRERPHLGVQFHPESILTRAQSEAATESDSDGHGDERSGNDGNGTDGNGTDISLALGKRMIANFCRFAATVEPNAEAADE
ncbi:aminodeoxychorismate/anthranilate synthase component II [Natrinema zhouii]|uniref:anthranilate synthase n=1 Tax=Natrinema zhouii TaxID=1710539 RepID=A0A7D6CMI9_9EURY|nr:aminodeoxychorismate/anthranilate synthase component II [Natrinema zhouii]QLK25015.1 aminodeoxychorismate/anthranilate synthase component II [Natrinema zhouii]